MAVEFSSSCRPMSPGESRCGEDPGADDDGDEQRRCRRPRPVTLRPRVGRRISSTGRRRSPGAGALGGEVAERSGRGRASAARSEPVVGPVAVPLGLDEARRRAARGGGGSRAAGRRRAPRRGGRRTAPRRRAAATIRHRNGSASDLQELEGRCRFQINAHLHGLWLIWTRTSNQIYSVRLNLKMAAPNIARPSSTTIPASASEGTGQPHHVTPGASVCRVASEMSRWLNTSRRIGSTP